ncbi:MAG: phage tail protein [Rhizobiaceae bacterium]|nr:phage tail protein [Rhizobiaceae bacterium]
MPLLALGPHRFEIEPLNFQAIEQEFEVKWPAISRFGGRPGRQMTGFGEDPIRISGLLHTHEFEGSREALDSLVRTHKAAKPLIMMGWADEESLKADVYGLVVILKVTHRGTKIGGSGKPRRMEYDIEIAPIPEAAGKPIGIFL